MITRQQIMDEARKWDGTPWRHQGRTERGIDCAGLIVKVAHALGLSTFDTVAYQRTAQRQKLLEYFAQEMDLQPLTQLKPGDVVAFRDSAYPCHVGLISERHGELYLIHAYALRKRVIEEPLNDDWRKKWIAAYKFRGIED